MSIFAEQTPTGFLNYIKGVGLGLAEKIPTFLYAQASVSSHFYIPADMLTEGFVAINLKVLELSKDGVIFTWTLFGRETVDGQPVRLQEADEGDILWSLQSSKQYLPREGVGGLTLTDTFDRVFEKRYRNGDPSRPLCPKLYPLYYSDRYGFKHTDFCFYFQLDSFNRRLYIKDVQVRDALIGHRIRSSRNHRLEPLWK